LKTQKKKKRAFHAPFEEKPGVEEMDNILAEEKRRRKNLAEEGKAEILITT